MSISEHALTREPYALYDLLRRQGPIHWSHAFCGGAWLLTDYADVASALKDPRFSVGRTGRWINSVTHETPLDVQAILQARDELKVLKRFFARVMLFVDGRRHKRLRQSMHAGFKPDFINGFAPRIEAIAERLIDAIVAKGQTSGMHTSGFTFDFIADFARPMPALVIAELLGLASDMCADFIDWSDDVAAFIGSMTPTMAQALQAQQSLIAMYAFLKEVVDKKRTHPAHDVISLLVQAQAAGQLSEHELLIQCCMLTFAGHETTRNLLGNGVCALLQHPDQWALLRQAPQHCTMAAKELLRFNSPVQYTARRLTEDVILHGQQCRRGDLVILLIGAANHDPKQFTRADQLDITRNEGNHLSFGYGPHVCIGAMLTYLEADIALRALLRRMPTLQLSTSVDNWHSNTVYRGLRTLPVFYGDGRDAQQAPCAPSHEVAYV